MYTQYSTDPDVKNPSHVESVRILRREINLPQAYFVDNGARETNYEGAAGE